MASGELELLRGARQAVDEGLISSGDYDVVKVAFLRAQQIKAGLDAGFIRTEDYEKARDAYLNALDFSMMATLPTAGGPGGGGGGVAPLRGAGGSFSELQQQQQASGAPRPSALASSDSGGRGGWAAGAAAAMGAAAGGVAAAAGRASFGSGSGGGGGGPAPAGSRGGSGAGARGGGGGAGPSPDVAAALAECPRYSKGAAAGKFSMAGIGLAEDCVNLFMHTKTRSAYKWLTFRIDDSGKTVIPDRIGGKASPYEEFVAALPPAECRYGVYDYDYNSRERGSFSKIVFINWAPEVAAIKTKMMYASTKDFFKGFLDGIGAELQANDASEVTEDELRLRVAGNLTRK